MTAPAQRAPGVRPPLPPLRQLVPPGPWITHGVCRGVDVDLFYPERGESTREAKAVCAGCPVRVECLEHALANGEKFGIWGGKSERERRAIRKARHARHTRGAAA